MRFQLTSEEARPIAERAAKFFRRQGMMIQIEKPLSAAAPVRTTLIAKRKSFHILIEAQKDLHYGEPQRKLAFWLSANRSYAEFYLATNADSQVQVNMLHDLSVDGVGILFVDELGAVTIERKARIPALVINPDPTLGYGGYKHEVEQAIYKFNNMNRKDGLRDMCELVERETENLGLKAIRKGIFLLAQVDYQRKDWNGQIDALASPQLFPSRAPLISPQFKNDLHSFRGARNLVDHPVRSRREDIRRERQFAERMMQGPRILSELLSLNRILR